MSSFLRPLSLLSKLENEKKKSETTSNRRSFDQVCNFRQHHVKKTKDAVKHSLGRDFVSLTTMFTFSREREADRECMHRENEREKDSHSRRASSSTTDVLLVSCFFFDRQSGEGLFFFATRNLWASTGKDELSR